MFGENGVINLPLINPPELGNHVSPSRVGGKRGLKQRFDAAGRSGGFGGGSII